MKLVIRLESIIVSGMALFGGAVMIQGYIALYLWSHLAKHFWLRRRMRLSRSWKEDQACALSRSPSYIDSFALLEERKYQTWGL